VTGEIALKMTGITKRFPGVLALDNVDFTVRKGEVHALLGENGAGKSTLMKILAGAYVKDSGEIDIFSRKAELGTPRIAEELGISIIYQELLLVEHLSSAENIFMGRLRHPDSILNGRKFTGMQNAFLENLRLISL